MVKKGNKYEISELNEKINEIDEKINKIIK
jgi:hypothetical protein